MRHVYIWHIMGKQKALARALPRAGHLLRNEGTQMKKILLFALAAALLLALAACRAPGASYSASVPESQSTAQSAISQSQSASGSAQAEVQLYIGMGGSFAEYTACVPAPAQPGDVIAAIGQLTGWDCTLARPVEQGEGFVKVCFSQQSALFAGPPQVQKDEFHMYDVNQMCLTLLDSVARTLQANFAGKDGEPLAVYYVPESGTGDLIVEQAGLTVPQDESYTIS